jgi:hypothetical protein
MVYPNYACLGTLDETDDGTLGNEAYNCDMSNPARAFMNGVNCQLVQTDLDGKFDRWMSRLSTTWISSGARSLIDTANSRLTYFCAGTAPTASPVRPPYPAFAAAPTPPAGWSQVLLYPNYMCLNAAVASDPATLAANAQGCDLGNPGRLVMTGQTCFLEQTDADQDYDAWLSSMVTTAATDDQQAALDTAASRSTYFCAH